MLLSLFMEHTVFSKKNSQESQIHFSKSLTHKTESNELTHLNLYSERRTEILMFSTVLNQVCRYRLGVFKQRVLPGLVKALCVTVVNCFIQGQLEFRSTHLHYEELEAGLLSLTLNEMLILKIKYGIMG